MSNTFTQFVKLILQDLSSRIDVQEVLICDANSFDHCALYLSGLNEVKYAVVDYYYESGEWVDDADELTNKAIDQFLTGE